jgi:hypothetical protein
MSCKSEQPADAIPAKLIRQCRACFGDLADDQRTIKWWVGLSDKDRRDLLDATMNHGAAGMRPMSECGIDPNWVTNDGEIGRRQ